MLRTKSRKRCARRWPAEFRYDISVLESWTKLPRVDWIVMNPPFNQINVIAPLALYHAGRGLAMFARLTWLEVAKGRRNWMAACSRWMRLLIFMPKVLYFLDHGPDMVGRIWIVWDKRHRGETRVIWDDWKSASWLDPRYDYQKYEEINAIKEESK